MQLYSSATSPFARKVHIIIHELSLNDKITRIPTRLNPIVGAPDSDTLKVAPHNPLGKLPTLVLPDGSAIYDSIVIAEYLDAEHGAQRFFPPPGPKRWAALTLHALGNGMCEAAATAFNETRTEVRPPELRCEQFIESQCAKVVRGLDYLEKRASEDSLATGDAITIGEVAVACALGYTDLRGTHLKWRDGRPALAKWEQEIAKRPSVKESRPPGV